jgi:hypothetical protein
VKIRQLEEEEAMLNLFNKRCQQFLQWAQNFENRLNQSQVTLSGTKMVKFCILVTKNAVHIIAILIFMY